MTRMALEEEHVVLLFMLLNSFAARGAAAGEQLRLPWCDVAVQGRACYSPLSRV